MTRQEIYDKIFKMLEKEQFHLQNRYDFGEIDLEKFEELSSKRYEEYLEYVRDLAICNDEDLETKMSFVIKANLETFWIKSSPPTPLKGGVIWEGDFLFNSAIGLNIVFNDIGIIKINIWGNTNCF